jgi:hypothetical protein
MYSNFTDWSFELNEGTLITWASFTRKSMMGSPCVMIVTPQQWFFERQINLKKDNRSVRLDRNPDQAMREMVSNVVTYWKGHVGIDVIPASSSTYFEVFTDRNFLIRMLVQRQAREHQGMYDLYVRTYTSTDKAYIGSFKSREKAMEYLEARMLHLSMLESLWWTKSHDWFVVE